MACERHQRSRRVDITPILWIQPRADSSLSRPSKFFAAKILNAEATSLHNVTMQMLERESLRQVAACEDINCLPVLRDEFTLRTKGGRQHICFIMDLLGPNLASIRMRGPTKALPHYVVRNILAQVVEGLVQLHGLNIVHTGTHVLRRDPSSIGLIHRQISNPTTSSSQPECQMKASSSGSRNSWNTERWPTWKRRTLFPIRSVPTVVPTKRS